MTDLNAGAGSTTPVTDTSASTTNTAITTPAGTASADSITTVLSSDAVTPTTELTTTTEDKGTTKPTDGESKTEGDKATEKSTIEYEAFTLPEGAEVDEKLMSDFTDIAKEAALPQETAQKFIDLFNNATKKFAENTWNNWKDTNAEWTKQVEADAEIGGRNFEAMKVTVSKAIQGIFDAKGEQAFKAGLNATGAGNHPEIIRGLYRMAKQVTEGGHVSGRPAGAPTSPAQKLYPNQPTQQ